MCRQLLLLVLALGLMAILTTPAAAQVNPPGGFSLNVGNGGAEAEGDWSIGIQLVLVMTLLTLAPALLIATTCFVRIVIVLGFVRQAMGTQQSPPNQVMIGLSLLLTAFIMQPVWQQVYDNAIVPYQEDRLNAQEAFENGAGYLKDFMLRQTRVEDFEFIGSLQADFNPQAEPKFTVVAAAFIMSELRTAFAMGVLIYLPFLIIDFVVASVLMSLGMMMMPPVMISLPVKLLLFTLVDGWRFLIEMLVRSFNLG